VKAKTTAKKRNSRGRGDRTIAKLIKQRSSVAQSSRDLSRLCGRKVTWGCVNIWKIRNSVSKSMVIYVHRLTGAPL